MTSRRVATHVLVAAGALTATACGRGAPRAADTSVPRSAAAQVALGARHNITVGGVRRGELRADTALFNDSTTLAELRGVRITFFSAAGDTMGTATAPAGIYDLSHRRITLRDGASVRAADGRRVQAPQVVYDAVAGRLTGAGDLTFAGPGAARRGIRRARR